MQSHFTGYTREVYTHTHTLDGPLSETTRPGEPVPER